MDDVEFVSTGAETDMVDTGPPLEADELYAVSGKRHLVMIVALGIGASALLLLVISMVCVLGPTEQDTEVAQGEQVETSTLIAGSTPTTPDVLSPSADASESAGEVEVAQPEDVSEPDAGAGASADAEISQTEVVQSGGGEATPPVSERSAQNRSSASGVSPNQQASSLPSSSAPVQQEDRESDPVRATLRRLAPSLRACFRRREREGTVMVSYRVSADGSMRYGGANPSPSLGAARCIREVVGRARVNPPPATERTINHPIVFLRAGTD